jgi:hypothetical protein
VGIIAANHTITAGSYATCPHVSTTSGDPKTPEKPLLFREIWLDSVR